MLLPEASDEVVTSPNPRPIARSGIGKSSTIAFPRSYRDNAGVQRQVAPAIGSAVLAVRVAGCGGGSTQAGQQSPATTQPPPATSPPVATSTLRTFTENGTPGSSGG